MPGFAPATGRPVQKQVEKPAEKSSKKLYLIIGIAVLLIAAFSVGLYFALSGEGDAPQEPQGDVEKTSAAPAVPDLFDLTPEALVDVYDGDTFKVGELDVRVMHSPGHTLASITYVIGDAAFVHDTLFQPDFGTARADFPGGDAATLYRSIQRILELPDATRVFTGHDYMPDGREPRWESTVGEQRARNPHLQDMDEAGYVALRNKRDAELPLPALMLAALQINTRGGRLPTPEDNGTSYLKIPMNRF